MNVLPEWVNLNKTFLKFFPPPVFLPEVLCERGVLAVAWWTRVPLHRGGRAHIWVWCSGRYSWMQRMSSPVFTHFRTADWLKTEERKCLNEQRKRLTHHHRFRNGNGNSERSIMLCVSKKTLCKHMFHLSLCQDQITNLTMSASASHLPLVSVLNFNTAVLHSFSAGNIASCLFMTLLSLQNV